MSESNESRVVEALEAVKAGMARLDDAVAAFLDDFRSLSDIRAQLKEVKGELDLIRAREETLGSAVSRIESAMHSAIKVARESVSDPSLSPEERVHLHACVSRVFGEFGSAGFDVFAPEIGSSFDESQHVCVGTAQSSLGPEAIADVVAWGYSFPSGDRRPAEVLVGSGSKSEEVAGSPAPDVSDAASKAGIAMRLEESKTPEKKRKVTAEGGGLFEHLAEAAKRNQQKE